MNNYINMPGIKTSSPTIFTSLKNLIYESDPVQRIISRINSEEEAIELARLPGSLPAFIVASIVDCTSRPVVLVARHTRAAERARDDLRSILGEERAFFLPPRAMIPYDPLHQNLRFDERAAVFEKLLEGTMDVLITVPATLNERFEDLKVQQNRIVKFQAHDEIDREALILVLSEMGMRRELRAEEPGQFAIRGAVIDLFPPSAEYPVRLELWGDEIVELRQYDPATQRSLKQISEMSFFAGENSPAERSLGVWNMISPETIFFIDDYDNMMEELERSWEEITYQYEKRRDFEIDRETPKPQSLFWTKGEVISALNRRRRVIHRGEAAPTRGAINFHGKSHDSYLGDLKRLAQHLSQYRIEDIQCIILCDREGQVERLEDLLEEYGVSLGQVRIGVGALHKGFTFPAANVAVLTDHQIFGRHKRTLPFRQRRRSADSRLFEQLQKGDFVVHTDFGIGRYLGLKTIKVGGVERECLQIEYQEGVKVYVRLEQFSYLQKYQGVDGAPPKLSRIGGSDWSRTRKKAQEAVEELAGEIIELYARRQLEGGFAFSSDSPWQREMEAAFEFEDTPDQAAAVEEIKYGMEQPIAMDRLLCGDVGFGKTEVAIRAAFKAVQDSKQVAVLVPTTILAQQHHATFVERLRRYPIRIETLSRFRTAPQQKLIVKAIAKGEVDIVIGTHRLFSNDVNFKDLGLLIIDEEHRFGVKQKEKLKKLRATVDVLTLTATPIPRTLHLALSGAKDMSLISTPPHDRQPIETEIAPFDQRLIREAILREMARGGQVYFLHNRVQSIMAIKRMLTRLLPEVRIGVAHGQMKERELEMVMEDFLHERYDVLVCTMIIESGLDIPNVNTLIVNRADRLGLAQLYQVRGRIGRSYRKAFAYLLTPPRMVLTTEARKRLETIAEHTRLGSGFQIAMRDLEIRGAGNLLGPQQSGTINQVGFDLYTDMLSAAVKKLSEETETALPELKQTADPRNVKVEVGVDAILPTSYVSEPSERVELYRRLSRMDALEAIHDLSEELKDRYGPIPEETMHLLSIVELQIRAALVDVVKIEVYEDSAFFYFNEHWGGDHFGEYVADILDKLQNMPIEFKGAGALGLKLSLIDCHEWSDRWQRIFHLLEGLPRKSLEEHSLL